jgi:hypothetical protein
VRLDRKLLLIAPTIVLVCVVAGMIYATLQLRFLSDVGTTWKDRSAFISAVERGEKTLEPRQTLALLRYSVDVEAKRTEAIVAMRDLLVALSAIALLACAGLVLGIRTVPRQHWPRFGKEQS